MLEKGAADEAKRAGSSDIVGSSKGAEREEAGWRLAVLGCRGGRERRVRMEVQP